MATEPELKHYKQQTYRVSIPDLSDGVRIGKEIEQAYQKQIEEILMRQSQQFLPDGVANPQAFIPNDRIRTGERVSVTYKLNF